MDKNLATLNTECFPGTFLSFLFSTNVSIYVNVNWSTLAVFIFYWACKRDTLTITTDNALPNNSSISHYFNKVEHRQNRTPPLLNTFNIGHHERRLLNEWEL